MSDALNKKHITKLRELAKKKSNKKCIDCGLNGPHANVVLSPFNIFVCQTCAGLHRSLSHKVKGVSMSTFSKEEVKAVEAGGNKKARKLWLAGYQEPDKPISSSDTAKISEKIIKTYERKLYHKDNSKDSSNDNEKKGLERKGSKKKMSRRTSEISELSQSFNHSESVSVDVEDEESESDDERERSKSKRKSKENSKSKSKTKERSKGKSKRKEKEEPEEEIPGIDLLDFSMGVPSSTTPTSNSNTNDFVFPTGEETLMDNFAKTDHNPFTAQSAPATPAQPSSIPNTITNRATNSNPMQDLVSHFQSLMDQYQLSPQQMESVCVNAMAKVGIVLSATSTTESDDLFAEAARDTMKYQQERERQEMVFSASEYSGNPFVDAPSISISTPMPHSYQFQQQPNQYQQAQAHTHTQPQQQNPFDNPFIQPQSQPQTEQEPEQAAKPDIFASLVPQF